MIFTFAVLARGEKFYYWEAGSAIYLIAALILGFGWLATLALIFIVTVELIVRSRYIQNVLLNKIYNVARSNIPKLSKTEEEALNSGSVWFESSIFRGEPDFAGLSEVRSELSAEERSFLSVETEILCEMLNNWDVTQSYDLPEDVWQYIKEKGFFGLVINKSYGGKGFTAEAHSEIVVKIASKCPAAAVTVMVPNSLGPGELLQHYGTEEQKEYFLPRLAGGKEIPCFALTEPGAGSDATSIQSTALVIERITDGKKELCLELSLNKRWITLAPVATLIGLAVNLLDPNHLLQGVGSEGITCLLISRDTPNLEIGNRHLPAQESFMNGTIRGKNIIVPISSIIGGQKMAGQGWHMLVECLSIGRSISLPALGAASSSVAYLTTGAYAMLRRQFNVSLADFEGIQERLAEIAGLTYLIHATRQLTLAAVDAGEKPSVASAITKFANTELARIVINHAMDIHGGRGIVVGPKNYLACFYQSAPITITVEGANIMTRNLLIFGQGAMACHPYLKQEFYALAADDKDSFKTLIWDHIQYFLQNFAKATCSAWTNGVLLKTPNSNLNRAYQKLSKLSFTYAWLADLTLMVLGGGLKRKERLSARLADVMSYLYMAMAALRFYEADEDNEGNTIHAEWATTYCFYHAEQAMLNVIREFPVRWMRGFIRLFLFPWGATMHRPTDKMDANLTRIMTTTNSFRSMLKQWIYNTSNGNDPIGQMETACGLLEEHAEALQKIRTFKYCNLDDIEPKLNEMVQMGLMTAAEKEIFLQVEQLRWNAIQVDEFALEDISGAKRKIPAFQMAQENSKKKPNPIKEEA